jgi:hypothetical protein
MLEYVADSSAALMYVTDSRLIGCPVENAVSSNIQQDTFM